MVHLGTPVVVLAFVLAACGGQAATSTGGDATQPSATAEATTVAVASSSLGDILVDGEGRTLYLFNSDEQGGPSTCYEGCAAAWPPLTGPAAAGAGADESLLSVTERDDGTQQVTYNGWPLYHYASDSAAGDTKGQGVGDVWFAVDAQGEAVTAAATDKPQGGRDY